MTGSVGQFVVKDVFTYESLTQVVIPCIHSFAFEFFFFQEGLLSVCL